MARHEKSVASGPPVVAEKMRHFAWRRNTRKNVGCGKQKGTTVPDSGKPVYQDLAATGDQGLPLLKES
jgi:hypothetical protein